MLYDMNGIYVEAVSIADAFFLYVAEKHRRGEGEDLDGDFTLHVTLRSREDVVRRTSQAGRP